MADPRRFGIIGLGRVGRAFALALHRRGTAGLLAWDKMATDTDGIADVTLCPSLSQVAQVDFLLLTIPDDIIATTAAELAALNLDWSGRTVAHVSGRCGADVLRPLHDRGATVIAFHPAMAFAGNTRVDAERIAGSMLAVTVLDPEAQPAGFAFATNLGATPFLIGNDDRTLYHAALVHATNHLVTLIVQAKQMLTALGVTDVGGILTPAVEAALGNSIERGAAAATGPVVRADAGTISDHIAALHQYDDALLDSYLSMTHAGIGIAKQAGRITSTQADTLDGVVIRGRSLIRERLGHDRS